MNARGAAASVFVAFALAAPVGWATAGPSVERSVTAGESIYRRGVLGSGAPLEATREVGGLTTRGADAACVNCHQRSGLGATEGRNSVPPISIPPIAGRYLFLPHARSAEEHNLPYVDGMRADREPYTEATLARAIRDGIDSEGRPLSYLMPRFRLDDADMAALIAYLKSLDATRVPGATDTVLHFATVITPDADPVKRAGMLDVMQHYFAEKNARQMVPSRRLQPSGKTMYAKTMFMVHRQWELHVWELTGPASTWKAQLVQHLAKEPVLAVISGLAGSDWAPVHQFCEESALPCLFPNVEVPVETPDDFYTLYFSKGVLLEAELIARRLAVPDHGEPARTVHQVFRTGDSGEPAARALASALKQHGIAVQEHVVAKDAPARRLSEAVRAASGTLGWFRIRKIPIVAEQTQADTYLACGLLSEVLSHMVDNFARAYLIEQLQTMIEHRVITGYYPRLTLATHQHFASKGGYLLHFADATGSKVVVDSPWLVP
jgi:hypothetical protein